MLIQPGTDNLYTASAVGKTGTFMQKSHAVAAYVGLALGDALGATVEFMTANEIRQQYGVHQEITGGGWLRLAPGMITDDTSMSLALGNVLIKNQRINPFDIAHAFSAWMKTKPVDIGNTVRRGIQNFRITNDPCAPSSEHAAGNGACMRCLPIAIACLDMPKTEVKRANEFQAHVTHHNALSDAATMCVIEMLQLGFNGADIDTLLADPVARLIHDHPEFDYSQQSITNPSGYIVDTLQAVFQAMAETDSFESCLVNVVNRGGDADTTGAIAGMLAGSVYGMESIPQRWIEQLSPEILLACQQQASALYDLRKQFHLSDSNPLI